MDFEFEEICDDIIEINVSSDLYKIINDFSNNLPTRKKALEMLYEKTGNDIIEIIRSLDGMYQFSGSKVIEKYLYAIATNSSVSSLVKLHAAKSLLNYNELEEDFESDDDEEMIQIKQESNDKIKNRNLSRRTLAYKALNCAYDITLPTPCRVEAIFMFMDSDDYKTEAEQYFTEFLRCNDIECEFRYKTILSLEKQKFGNIFMENAQIVFLTHVYNLIYYRILSAQYLLRTIQNESTRIMTEKILSEFALDETIDYDRRADSADILMQLGSPDMKNFGRNIISILGRNGAHTKTIFDNAQNVHTEKVEESVSEILEHLSELSLLKINGIPITIEYVVEQVENILKIEAFNFKSHISTCKYMHVTENDYCDEKCQKLYERDQKIKLALSRIVMDRALYSKYNNSLANILLKIWTYINGNEHENEMRKRLLEELEEMSGTCSTGFASRLINVISGFGEFNIRISWSDQITANFIGRLNALARKITDTSSIYYSTQLNNVIDLWLNSHTDTRDDIITKLKEIPVDITLQSILSYFREKYSEQIQTCVEDFSENVINEMANLTSEFSERQNFSLFFRSSMSSIREELYNEFKEYISDDEFDMSFRKAIMVYEDCM